MSATYFDFALGVMKVIGPLILLGAIAYAVLQWRSRSKASDEIGERKAKQLYTTNAPNETIFRARKRWPAGASHLTSLPFRAVA
jgi:hypothetical protein